MAKSETEDFNLEIGEPTQNMFSKSNSEFHSSLVFAQYQRVQEALSEEMVEGFWEEKADNLGNVKPIYHRDTRRIAIERILTLKNTMINDLVKSKLKTKVNEIIKKADELFKTSLENQKKWWNGLTPPLKHDFQKKNSGFIYTLLNSSSLFYHQYLTEVITIYRDLFEVLELCLGEGGYFSRTAKIG